MQASEIITQARRAKSWLDDKPKPLGKKDSAANLNAFQMWISNSPGVADICHALVAAAELLAKVEIAQGAVPDNWIITQREDLPGRFRFHGYIDIEPKPQDAIR